MAFRFSCLNQLSSRDFPACYAIGWPFSREPDLGPSVREYVPFNHAGIYVGGLAIDNTLEEVRRLQEVNDDFVASGRATSVEEAKEQVKLMTPIGRVGRAEEVANVVRFLASDASSSCPECRHINDYFSLTYLPGTSQFWCLLLEKVFNFFIEVVKLVAVSYRE